MIKNDLKYNLIKQFISYKYCADLTGETVDLIKILEFCIKEEEERKLAKIFSYTLDEYSLSEAYKIYSNTINISSKLIKNRIWKMFPEIHIIYYIIYKYGYTNETLFSLLYLYYIEENIATKKEIALKFLNLYLYFTVNQLIKDKFYVYSLLEPKENIEKYFIRNKQDEYSFKNLSSIKEVVNLISQSYIGSI